MACTPPGRGPDLLLTPYTHVHTVDLLTQGVPHVECVCLLVCCLCVLPQGLSNLLWSCATLGHKDPAFLAAATHECSARIERMSSQNLSNVLWACATLGHADSRLLGNWAEAVMHKLDVFEPQVRPIVEHLQAVGLNGGVAVLAIAHAALLTTRWQPP